MKQNLTLLLCSESFCLNPEVKCVHSYICVLIICLVCINQSSVWMWPISSNQFQLTHSFPFSIINPCSKKTSASYICSFSQSRVSEIHVSVDTYITGSNGLPHIDCSFALSSLPRFFFVLCKSGAIAQGSDGLCMFASVCCVDITSLQVSADNRWNTGAGLWSAPGSTCYRTGAAIKMNYCQNVI